MFIKVLSKHKVEFIKNRIPYGTKRSPHPWIDVKKLDFPPTEEFPLTTEGKPENAGIDTIYFFFCLSLLIRRRVMGLAGMPLPPFDYQGMELVEQSVPGRKAGLEEPFI